MALIKVLGSASGVATESRFHNSVLLKSEKEMYLFDCGEPVSPLLVRNGFNPLDIDRIFISHMHIDHIGGLPQLIQYMQLRKRVAPLYVFMPQEGISVLTKFLEAVYLFREIMPFELCLLPIDSKRDKNISQLTVEPIPNMHLHNLAKFAQEHGYEKNKGQSYSFICSMKENGNDFRIAYTGDMANCGEIENLLEFPVDLLITEFAHFNVEQFVQKTDLLKNAEKILITHIGPALNNSIEKDLIQAVPDILKQKIIIAKDGTEVIL